MCTTVYVPVKTTRVVNISHLIEYLVNLLKVIWASKLPLVVWWPLHVLEVNNTVGVMDFVGHEISERHCS
jgi:hypothetical protein